MNVHLAAPAVLAALAATLLTACERPAPAAPAAPAASAASAVQGAWSVAGIRVIGPDSAANTAVQPSLYLFADKYYSMMRITGNDPRAFAVRDSATNAERFGPFETYIANAGTYEVADSTITIHPVVARSPNFMAGGSDKYYFRVSGDTLWLSNTGADFRTMSGGRLMAPGARNAVMLVLVRQK